MKKNSILGSSLFVLGVITTASIFGSRAGEGELIQAISKALSKEERVTVIVPIGKGEEFERHMISGEAKETAHYKLLESLGIRKSVKAIDNAEVFSKIRVELGDNIHLVWQNENVARGTRFKPIKVDGKTLDSENALQKYLDERGFSPEFAKDKFKMADDGKGHIVAQEDILHLPNRYLAPNNAFENSISGDIAAYFVDAWVRKYGRVDNRLLYFGSDFIHEQWMARNGSWAPKEQMVPFEQLTAEEAKKDMVIIQDAIDKYVAAASGARLDGIGAKLKSL